MTTAIPVAQTPPGENLLYHLRTPQRDLLAYVEYLASQGDIVQFRSLLPEPKHPKQL